MWPYVTKYTGKGKVDFVGTSLLTRSIIAVVVLIVAFLTIGRGILVDAANMVRVLYYEQTEGEVVSLSNENPYGSANLTGIVTTISYEVEGQQYELQIKEIITSAPGEKYVICYNAKNPEKAFVKEYVGGAVQGFFSLIAPFLVFGGGTAIVVILIRKVLQWKEDKKNAELRAYIESWEQENQKNY